MLDTIYLNGAYLSRNAATLHVSDLSILRGYGVFDYFRYRSGRPRFVSDHAARFRRSAEGLHLPLDYTDAELQQIVEELIHRNGGGDGGIRFVLTGGYAEDGYTPRDPNFLALPYAFSQPAEFYYEKGCTVLLHRYERQLPRIKSIDYIEGIRIQPALKRVGAQYPLYVDRDGHVRESDRSNFMIVREGKLIAPVEDILLGITRHHLLKLAAEMGISIEERKVTTSELLAADEAIICSSVKGAMPITQIVSGSTFSNRAFGSPGPFTLQLMEAWKAYE
ncbi:branched-chain amino acid aminotransferase [Neolewinella xylanilytica]|uniref:branched-chain-amino-acid transaminase n=1 Tax=Neolewinella xylanilytica TaxID=1514080 RepID=A0A2S6I054_9BACT|nr:aminotransferase class IV [Neolewinella xylanilytica]PPK84238.1 branched-chain amino acid aminotransferase [Neolewinella xylanilytica]